MAAIYKSRIANPKPQIPNLKSKLGIPSSDMPSLPGIFRWELERGFGASDLLSRQRGGRFFSQMLCAARGMRVAQCKTVIVATKTAPQYLVRSGKLLRLQEMRVCNQATPFS